MTIGHNQIRSFVDRIENLETEIKELNSDKSDVYAEAKSVGFDVKALKAVVARRRKDPSEVTEHEAIVETYIAILESGTVPALARARTRQVTTTDAPGAAHTNALDPRIEYAEPVCTLTEADIPKIDHNDRDGIPAFLDRRT